MTSESSSGPGLSVRSKFEAVVPPPPPPPPVMRHRPLGGTYGSNKTWLVSFTDIMGLMLTFFVMMFAMADRGHVTHPMSAGVEGHPSGTFQGGIANMGNADSITVARTQYAEGLDTGYLVQVLKSKQESVPAFAHLGLSQDRRGAVLSLPADKVLDMNAGAIARGDEAKTILMNLDQVLRAVPNDVEIGLEWPADKGFYDGVGRSLVLARVLRQAMRAESEGMDKNMKIFIPAQGIRPPQTTPRILWRILPLKPNRP